MRGTERPHFSSARAHDALARFLDEQATQAGALLDARCRAHALPVLPVLPAPVLLSVALRAGIAQAAEELVALLSRALDARLAAQNAVNDDDTRFLAVPQELAPFVAREDANARLSCVRLDGLVDEESGALRFVEVQAGDPSGLGWTDFALDAWTRSGLLAAVGVPPDPLLPAHRRVGQAHVTSTTRPRVVHVCPDASFVRSDHACMAALAREAGCDTLLVDAHALHWSGGALTCDGATVDAIVRDTHEELVGPHAVVGARALLDAVMHGLPHQNAFADATLDDKGSFALLFDERYRAPLDTRDRARIDTSVLETHLADDDARARAHDAPASWVLKPRFGYGGFGIVVGDDDAEAFRSALVSARADTHVLQRFLSTTPEPVWVRTGAGVACAPRFLTFSAWVIGRRFAGCYARAGEGRVVNVHQGGGIAPVLFV